MLVTQMFSSDLVTFMPVTMKLVAGTGAFFKAIIGACNHENKRSEKRFLSKNLVFGQQR